MQWWEYHPCQLGIWHPGWAQRSPRRLSPGHGDTWPTTEGRHSRDASSLPGSVSVSVPNSWPLTLAARFGLSSHGGGQHAPCRFPAASQPGSLLRLGDLRAANCSHGAVFWLQCCRAPVRARHLWTPLEEGSPFPFGKITSSLNLNVKGILL